MNLTPTEIDRLLIFTAAEHARRLRAHGVRLSHPEAVALLADEMLLDARKGLAYEAIVDRAARLLTAAEVEPGVPEMIEFVSVEANFEEGNKMVIVFRPFAPADASRPAPGEIVSPDAEIELNAGRAAVELDVTNTGDRDIQVRSHAHFFETNRALRFDRALAYGMRLDVPSGSGVRFEPGLRRTVTLVPFAGDRIVHGQAGLVRGRLDDPAVRAAALDAARRAGYLGA
ncbi:MAG: urease subunit beta [Burkholderiales bacterium]|nr:urease subunit beta [Burkholderiales bacterium]